MHQLLFNFYRCYKVCSSISNDAYRDNTGKAVVLFIPMAPMISNDTVENANAIFNMYKEDQTPVKSVSCHNKMLAQLSRNLTTDWETLARMLGLNEASVYAIRRDYIYSVKEQAVQMFQQWITVNGTRATLGTLTTAVYESGVPYWNLLEVMYQHVQPNCTH